jgi:hypothetical protein
VCLSRRGGEKKKKDLSFTIDYYVVDFAHSFFLKLSPDQMTLETFYSNERERKRLKQKSNKLFEMVHHVLVTLLELITFTEKG